MWYIKKLTKTAISDRNLIYGVFNHKSCLWLLTVNFTWLCNFSFWSIFLFCLMHIIRISDFIDNKVVYLPFMTGTCLIYQQNSRLLSTISGFVYKHCRNVRVFLVFFVIHIAHSRYIVVPKSINVSCQDNNSEHLKKIFLEWPCNCQITFKWELLLK